MATVVHLTSAHRVKDVRIYHKECVSLARAGHEVHLVVPTNTYQERERIGGGVFVHPVPEPSGRMERFLVTTFRAFNVARQLRADIFHFHDPELLPWGALLRSTGHTVVYDVHESLRDSLQTRGWIPEGIRPLIGRAAGLTESLFARWMSGIIAVTPSIREQFAALDVPSAVISNYPLLHEMQNGNGRDASSERVLKAVFAGGIAEARGIRQMVEAQSIVAGTHPQAKLGLAGTFRSERLKNSISQLAGWEHTEFHGWVSREDVSSIFSNASVGLVTFLPAPNHREALPNKLFEYMSAGLPVIASDFPLWRKIVEETDCGLVVDPEDPHSIADAIGWMYDNPKEAKAMGQRGQRAVLDTYNWSTQERELVSFYNKLL